MTVMRTKITLGILVLAVYLLHQDCWNWTNAEPLWFGFLPPGLAYHAGYCLLAAALMAVLVRFAWPRDLEKAGAMPNPSDQEDGK
jgi:hypothetical protein